MALKYIIVILKYIFFISTLTFFSFPANSELSVEEIIKGRKAIFNKNYTTAKKVQILASKGDFEKAKIKMIEMSDNYNKKLANNIKSIGTSEDLYRVADRLYEHERENKNISCMEAIVA